MKYHIGRSWSGTRLEDDCPCEKAPCGLVASMDDSCPQHSPFAIKTIRQMHTEDNCPGENMIDPKSCHEYDTYYGFVGGLERKLVRAEPYLDEPWVYEDNNGVRHSVSDRNVSHLSTKPRFLVESEPDLDQDNQKLHNEWMIEHIRANAAEDRVRQLEDYIRGEE